MPRLPRVTSTACIRVVAAAAVPPARARRASSSIADAEHLLDLGFVRRAGRQSAVVEQPVPRIDEHGHRAPARALRETALRMALGERAA